MTAVYITVSVSLSSDVINVNNVYRKMFNKHRCYFIVNVYYLINPTLNVEKD